LILNPACCCHAVCGLRNENLRVSPPLYR